MRSAELMRDPNMLQKIIVLLLERHAPAGSSINLDELGAMSGARLAYKATDSKTLELQALPQTKQ